MTTLPASSPHGTTRAPGSPVDRLWRTEGLESKKPRLEQASTGSAPTPPPQAAGWPIYEVLSNVANGFWEPVEKGKRLVRHHLQPRRALYDPGRAQDLPVPLDTISRQRTTVLYLPEGRKVIHEAWVTSQRNVNMDKKWTGYTVFFVIDSKNALQAAASCQNPQTMSRKDKKALKKELPWSAIPFEHRELYRQKPW